MNEITKPRSGKVVSVEDADHFVIRFTIPGVIENGRAYPLHTLHEPKPGDEVAIFGGDGVLNNLFYYILIMSPFDKMAGASESVIMRAFGNYIQNVNGAGIEIVSENGDVVADAKNVAMVHGASGAGIKSDKELHVEGNGIKLEKILSDIWTVFNSTATMYQAGGMPVTLVSPGKLPDISSDIEKMLGTVDFSVMKDGGGSGSVSAGSSPGSAETKTFSSNTKTCLEDVKSQLDTIRSAIQTIMTCLASGVVSPMGPCTCPGAAQLAGTIAQLTSGSTKLQTDITGSEAK